MPANTHVCLAVLQTLSFGLPPPAGPIVAAGLQLIDMLLGTNAGDEKGKALQEALDAMKQDIENFITENKLSDIDANLKTMQDWLEESQASLKRSGAIEQEEVIQAIIAGSDTLLSDQNPVEIALNRLLGLPTRGDDAYAFNLSAVDMYMNVLTSFICSLKFRCEMRSKLLALANRRTAAESADGQDVDARQRQLFADFDLFLGRLDHWTSDEKMTAVTRWFAQIKKQRIDSISGVKTEGSDSHFFTTSVATDYFEEGHKRIYARQHEPQYHYPPPGVHTIPTVTFISHKDDVENHRKMYIDAAKLQTDIDLSFVGEAMKTIKGQVAQLQMPVPPPNAAPKLEWFATEWKGAWRESADSEVRYGMSFVRDSRETDVLWGEWSKAPKDSDRRKCPRLTLPIDPKNLVASRKIKRQLRTGGGDSPKSYTVLLPENSSTAFIDIDPVDSSAVCPVPILPPEFDSWSRAYAAAGAADAGAPSWPPGYAVRYRYEYVNDAGKSPYRSIWALHRDTSAQDSEGYINGGSHYLARIKIPRSKDANFKVFRQFKGKEETEVNGTTEVKGNVCIFTDATL